MISPHIHPSSNNVFCIVSTSLQNCFPVSPDGLQKKKTDRQGTQFQLLLFPFIERFIIRLCTARIGSGGTLYNGPIGLLGVGDLCSCNSPYSCIHSRAVSCQYWTSVFVRHWFLYKQTGSPNIYQPCVNIMQNGKWYSMAAVGVYWQL